MTDDARVPVTDDALVEKVARALLEQESERIVRDMASHVGDEIHAVLKRHGMMMTTTGGTVAVGILAAIQVLAETVAFARRSMDGDAEDEAAIVQAAMKLFAMETTAAIPEFAAIAYPAGVAAGREEVSAAIREVRLAEAGYADGRAGAVNRLDAALKALFAYEVPAIRQRGE